MKESLELPGSCSHFCANQQTGPEGVTTKLPEKNVPETETENKTASRKTLRMRRVIQKILPIFHFFMLRKPLQNIPYHEESLGDENCKRKGNGESQHN
jgi:hypothetical protein